MNPNQWARLKPGDQIMNKRSPGFVLTVVARELNNRMPGLLIDGRHGQTWVKDENHAAYQLVLEQIRVL